MSKVDRLQINEKFYLIPWHQLKPDKGEGSL